MVHPAVKKLTVRIHPHRSSGYTHQLLQGLVGSEAEIDFGSWGTAVSVKFTTAKEADFFRELCMESGWEVSDD